MNRQYIPFLLVIAILVGCIIILGLRVLQAEEVISIYEQREEGYAKVTEYYLDYLASPHIRLDQSFQKTSVTTVWSDRGFSMEVEQYENDVIIARRLVIHIGGQTFTSEPYLYAYWADVKR